MHHGLFSNKADITKPNTGLANYKDRLLAIGGTTRTVTHKEQKDISLVLPESNPTFIVKYSSGQISPA